MHKPIATFAGRLWSAAKLTKPDNGKPFVEFTVKLAPRAWQGKTYFQKVYVRSYFAGAADQVDQLQEGTLVTVTGEADAVPEQGRDGKAYANLRVVGQFWILEAGAPAQEPTRNGPMERHSPPPPSPRQPCPPADDDRGFF